MKAQTHKRYAVRLAVAARRMFFPRLRNREVQEDVECRLAEMLEEIYELVLAAERQALRRLATAELKQQPQRAPPELQDLLVRLLGTTCLWSIANGGQAPKARAPDGSLEAWLARPPKDLDAKLAGAAVRTVFGRPEEEDRERIKAWLRKLGRKERVMSSNVTYKVDPRNVPSGVSASSFETEFDKRVDPLLKNTTFNLDDQDKAAIKGILIVDGYASFGGDELERGVNTAIREVTNKRKDAAGTAVANTEIYDKVSAVLSDGGSKDVYYEEVAEVGRAVFQNLDRIVFSEDSQVASQIDEAAQEYGTGGGTVGGLDLPDLAEESEDELVPENIRAVGIIYAAYQLEQARLFDVVDRIMEQFMNGLLPVGFDAAGRALDRLYFEREDMYDQSARFMQYSRVLGAAGGDVSTEVLPNSEFESIWMRFLASVSEFDRQLRVADVFSNTAGRRSLGTTAEHVRKAGRDVAANASLYGWANTHFAARRMGRMIQEYVAVLRLPEILSAHGVQTPWQVIERVSTREWGKSPNIVRSRTLADSGKKIFDTIAAKARAWTGTTPMFEITLAPAASSSSASRPTAAFNENERMELTRHVESILAVLGIKDAQLDEYSEPSESTLAPSIPSVSGGGNGGNGSGQIEQQIRQLIESGQQPSIDDLRRLTGIN